MHRQSLLMFVLMIGLASTGFGQRQQQTHEEEGADGDATTACQSTFTSGTNQTFFQFCTTINGNVAEFQSPAKEEHIRIGTIFEGYGICDFDSLIRYFDWAAFDSGNWQASVLNQPNGPSTFPLTITRTTSDGIYTLTQVFARDTVEPSANIKMTLKNNTAAAHDFALVRYADIDANNGNGGNFKNEFDFTHDAAFGYNSGFNLNGVMLFAVPSNTTRFAFVQNIPDPPDPCGPVNNLPPTTPFFGDGSVGYDWNGTLGAHKSLTVTGEYRRF